jgi:hypothetical protein
MKLKMSKASMIMEICTSLKIKYLPSMYKMTLEEVTILYNGLMKVSLDIKEIKEMLK